ncbi:MULTISPECIES: Tex family protein [unclassified Aureimonas]|uniref:Tex family protein n=1 Tax=unclassified Aureimonas TaxID=2615206 RepID=UPI0006F52ACD|nr:MULTISPECIES: Tex family protein [unclassified Aureimonas]KQT64176.1 RNA-binding transcriptional accessory protein [Aureimonas sp. Leaf427]KQT81365.1 RNA-binding transcriptional accessory protein [Aureimonas sp. Leaf460]
MSTPRPTIETTIAREIGARAEQVSAAVALLDGGATVPFVARYRKEATGGLDDVQLRALETRLVYLRELEARREAILKSVREQGKLTDQLANAFLSAATRVELEDAYLPYRPKRRNRADAARERGLGPLAERILSDRTVDPAALAKDFVTPDVPDAKAALEGARDIVAETMADNPALVGEIRRHLVAKAQLRARVVAGKETEGAKFSDYFDHTESFAKAPSHRVLALLRAQNEGVVSVEIEVDAEDTSAVKPVEAMVARHSRVRTAGGSAADEWLVGVARWAWRQKIRPHITSEMMGTLKEGADTEAIRVFSRNLKDLLLAAPAGAKATMGLDPGIRTGVKVAVIDATGRHVDSATVYPFQPRNDVKGASATLAGLMAKHGIELVAIGNGTASRETEQLAAEVIAALPGKKPVKAIVSEAGASVYSASEIASREMPDVDVSIRGAVSIARRLQDPLSELIKVDPKAIGVGQYQHDVDQGQLSRALDAVVEDAVNAVGVDLNTASSALLSRVAGLGPSLAGAIVAHRDAQGPFKTRRKLLDVPRLGPKAFEQCAGFLRITGGTEPLDASAVHPEAYPVARKIVAALGKDVASVMREPSALRTVSPERFVGDGFGLPTVVDIIAELEKPGRDPRPAFRTAAFAEGVNAISDLRPGMQLEGTVTNVAAFGAFVDIGVHQDGLVHVSQLSDTFVKDPNEKVRVGQVVSVRVVEVDIPRKRISLSMKSRTEPGETRSAPPRDRPDARRPAPASPKPAPAASTGSFGAALADAFKRK